MTFAKIEEKIKLYGCWNTLYILLKSLLKKLTTITWDKYYLLSIDLSRTNIQFNDNFIIRKLTIEDYNSELWKDFLFNSNKKQKYIERFQNKNAQAYGVFIDNKLAYSCWILYGEILIKGTFSIDIPQNSGLLLDDYCLPQYRGMGIHRYAIWWRSQQIVKNGGQKCFSVVLSYNKPALKSLYKCGLRVEKSFYVYRIGTTFKCTLNKVD